MRVGTKNGRTKGTRTLRREDVRSFVPVSLIKKERAFVDQVRRREGGGGGGNQNMKMSEREAEGGEGGAESWRRLTPFR